MTYKALPNLTPFISHSPTSPHPRPLQPWPLHLLSPLPEKLFQTQVLHGSFPVLPQIFIQFTLSMRFFLTLILHFTSPFLALLFFIIFITICHEIC